MRREARLAVRVQFLEPVNTGQGKWTSARTVAMFDCAQQKVAVKENTYFIDEKRNLVAQHKVVGKPGFGTTIKGTLADVALALDQLNEPVGNFIAKAAKGAFHDHHDRFGAKRRLLAGLPPGYEVAPAVHRPPGRARRARGRQRDGRGAPVVRGGL